MSTAVHLLSTPRLGAIGLLLAVALLLVGDRRGRSRWRALVAQVDEPQPQPRLRPAWIAVGVATAAALGWLLHGGVAGAVVGSAAALGVGVAARSLLDRAAGADVDPVELAAAWELLAVCLQAGLPVSSALEAAAEPVRGSAGRRLRRVAGLLALGAEPATAWRTVEDVAELSVFARAASRSASTGAALARVARTESARLRSELLDTAQARAQRAAVQITAPLGACFLPAFLVLGVAPVVIGLASEALARW